MLLFWFLSLLNGNIFLFLSFLDGNIRGIVASGVKDLSVFYLIMTEIKVTVEMIITIEIDG